MDQVDGAERTAGLRLALRKLTQGLGVERKDLLDAIEGELGPLRQYWGLNFKGSEGADLELVLQSARDAINIYLVVQIDRLVPPKGKSKRQFQRAVSVGFNIEHTGKYSTLKEKDLTRRFEWLENRAPEADRIDARTSRRYLARAIDQIVQQLTVDDYQPVVPPPVASDPISSIGQPDRKAISDLDERATARTQTGGTARGQSLLARLSRLPGRRLAILVAAIVAIPLGATIADSPFFRSSPPAVDTTPPLRLTLDQITAQGGAYHTLFHLSLQHIARNYRQQYANSSDPQGVFRELLDSGAYARDGMALSLQISNTGTQELTVTDIRLVNLICSVTPATEVVDLPGQGPPLMPAMAFDLNSSDPIARAIERANGREQYGLPYFEQQGAIGIRPNEKESLAVAIIAREGTCNFNLAVDYSVGDSKRTEYLRNDPARQAVMTLGVGSGS